MDSPPDPDKIWSDVSGRYSDLLEKVNLNMTRIADVAQRYADATEINAPSTLIFDQSKGLFDALRALLDDADVQKSNIKQELDAVLAELRTKTSKAAELMAEQEQKNGKLNSTIAEYDRLTEDAEQAKAAAEQEKQAFFDFVNGDRAQIQELQQKLKAFEEGRAVDIEERIKATAQDLGVAIQELKNYKENEERRINDGVAIGLTQVYAENEQLKKRNNELVQQQQQVVDDRVEELESRHQAALEETKDAAYARAVADLDNISFDVNTDAMVADLKSVINGLIPKNEKGQTVLQHIHDQNVDILQAVAQLPAAVSDRETFKNLPTKQELDKVLATKLKETADVIIVSMPDAVEQSDLDQAKQELKNHATSSEVINKINANQLKSTEVKEILTTLITSGQISSRSDVAGVVDSLYKDPRFDDLLTKTYFDGKLDNLKENEAFTPLAKESSVGSIVTDIITRGNLSALAKEKTVAAIPTNITTSTDFLNLAKESSVIDVPGKIFARSEYALLAREATVTNLPDKIVTRSEFQDLAKDNTVTSIPGLVVVRKEFTELAKENSVAKITGDIVKHPDFVSLAKESSINAITTNLVARPEIMGLAKEESLNKVASNVTAHPDFAKLAKDSSVTGLAKVIVSEPEFNKLVTREYLDTIVTKLAKEGTVNGIPGVIVAHDKFTQLAKESSVRDLLKDVVNKTDIAQMATAKDVRAIPKAILDTNQFNSLAKDGTITRAFSDLLRSEELHALSTKADTRLLIKAATEFIQKQLVGIAKQDATNIAITQAKDMIRNELINTNTLLRYIPVVAVSEMYSNLEQIQLLIGQPSGRVIDAKLENLIKCFRQAFGEETENNVAAMSTSIRELDFEMKAVSLSTDSLNVIYRLMVNNTMVVPDPTLRNLKAVQLLLHRIPAIDVTIANDALTELEDQIGMLDRDDAIVVEHARTAVGNLRHAWNDMVGSNVEDFNSGLEHNHSQLQNAITKLKDEGTKEAMLRNLSLFAGEARVLTAAGVVSAMDLSSEQNFPLGAATIRQKRFRDSPSSEAAMTKRVRKESVSNRSISRVDLLRGRPRASTETSSIPDLTATMELQQAATDILLAQDSCIEKFKELKDEINSIIRRGQTSFADETRNWILDENEQVQNLIKASVAREKQIRAHQRLAVQLDKSCVGIHLKELPHAGRERHESIKKWTGKEIRLREKGEKLVNRLHSLLISEDPTIAAREKVLKEAKSIAEIINTGSRYISGIEVQISTEGLSQEIFDQLKADVRDYQAQCSEAADKVDRDALLAGAASNISAWDGTPAYENVRHDLVTRLMELAKSIERLLTDLPEQSSLGVSRTVVPSAMSADASPQLSMSQSLGTGRIDTAFTTTSQQSTDPQSTPTEREMILEDAKPIAELIRFAPQNLANLRDKLYSEDLELQQHNDLKEEVREYFEQLVEAQAKIVRDLRYVGAIHQLNKWNGTPATIYAQELLVEVISPYVENARRLNAKEFTGRSRRGALGATAVDDYQEFSTPRPISTSRIPTGSGNISGGTLPTRSTGVFPVGTASDDPSQRPFTPQLDRPLRIGTTVVNTPQGTFPTQPHGPSQVATPLTNISQQIVTPGPTAQESTPDSPTPTQTTQFTGSVRPEQDTPTATVRFAAASTQDDQPPGSGTPSQTLARKGSLRRSAGTKNSPRAASVTGKLSKSASTWTLRSTASVSGLRPDSEAAIAVRNLSETKYYITFERAVNRDLGGLPNLFAIPEDWNAAKVANFADSIRDFWEKAQDRSSRTNSVDHLAHAQPYACLFGAISKQGGKNITADKPDAKCSYHHIQRGPLRSLCLRVSFVSGVQNPFVNGPNNTVPSWNADAQFVEGKRWVVKENP